MAVLTLEECATVYSDGLLTSVELSTLYDLWMANKGKRINAEGMFIGFEDSEVAAETDQFLGLLEGATGWTPTVSRERMMSHFFEAQMQLAGSDGVDRRSPEERVAAQARMDGQVVSVGP